jgi:hypothetical protein
MLLELGFNKYAGGGARTFKSFRRILERSADVLAERLGKTKEQVFEELVGNSKTLRHVPMKREGLIYQGAPGLKEIDPKRPVFLSYGGWYFKPHSKPEAKELAAQAITPGGFLPERVRESKGIENLNSALNNFTPLKGQLINHNKIRQMRGKFGIDPNHLKYPMGGVWANAITFKGQIPKQIIRERFGPTNKGVVLPRDLILANQWNLPPGESKKLITKHDLGLFKKFEDGWARS